MVARHAPVNVGDMTTPLVFRRRFEKDAPDTEGNTLLEWQDVTPVVWASVYVDRDAVRENAARPQNETAWKIVIRWCPEVADLNAATDVAYDMADRAFRIDAVLPSDRKDFVSIMATTGVAV
jgi:head-tail adaptor